MHRFTGEGPEHRQLDDVPYETLPELHAARRTEDRRIIEYVDGLSETEIASQFTYTPITNPNPITQARGPALAHLFNHQTHHRGQAHCLLTITGGRDAAPPLDLIYFQRESKTGIQ